jgi:hypothetical protein
LHDIDAMRARAALLVCLLLPPSAALAQTAGAITISESSDLDNGGKDDGVINIAECKGQDPAGTAIADTKVSFQWTLTEPPAGDSFYTVHAMTASCPNAGDQLPTTGIVDLTDTFQATGGAATGFWPLTGTLSAKADITSQLGVDCTQNVNINICVLVWDNGQVTIQSARATGLLKVNTDTPGRPNITSVLPGDHALNVSWEAGTGVDAFSYTVSASAPGLPTVSHSLTGTGSTSYRLSGLELVPYDVQVQAFSQYYNPSDTSTPDPYCASNVDFCTPASVDDFWRWYAKNGGSEQGGCGGGAGALALLALLPLAPRLRRRRP